MKRKKMLDVSYKSMLEAPKSLWVTMISFFNPDDRLLVPSNDSSTKKKLFLPCCSPDYCRNSLGRRLDVVVVVEDLSRKELERATATIGISFPLYRARISRGSVGWLLALSLLCCTFAAALRIEAMSDSRGSNASGSFSFPSLRALSCLARLFPLKSKKKNETSRGPPVATVLWLRQIWNFREGRAVWPEM